MIRYDMDIARRFSLFSFIMIDAAAVMIDYGLVSVVKLKLWLLMSECIAVDCFLWSTRPSND